MKKEIEDNWLSLVISNLALLRTLFDNEEISSMQYDGNREDAMEEIDELIEYLNKTN